MTLNTLRPRKDVRNSGPNNPTVSQGTIIGETYQVTTAPYERFALVDRVVLGWGTYSKWVGTQGTIIDPDILNSTNANLVAMYTMDDIVGSTLNDESVNNNNGTITGAITATGVIGNSLSFDGVDDFVNCNFQAGSQQSGALSIWATRGASTNQVLSAKAPNATGAFLLLQWEDSTGEARIVASDGVGTTGVVTTGNSVAVDANVFHHLVFQSNGSAWDIWLNGVQETLTIDEGGNVGDWWGDIGAFNILLGALDRATDTFGQLKMDHIRFFDRTLTQLEITALYNEGVPA